MRLVTCTVCLLVFSGCEDMFGTLEAQYVFATDAKGSADSGATPDATPDTTSPDVPTPPPTPKDGDGDGVSADKDCNDADASVTLPTVWFKDGDGDGWGSKVTTTACDQPENFVTTNEDCDDTSASINPDATEVCDNVDNDCDGVKDNATGNVWYLDADGDSHGDPDKAIKNGCTGPNFLSSVGDDCDDMDSGTRPGASEVCDKADNNCDGETDEDAIDAPTWYVDKDLDGYGTMEFKMESCEAGVGFSDNADDCDDENEVTNPGASEFCDEHDNDCDGKIDEDATFTSYLDADGDGYGDPAVAFVGCYTPEKHGNDNTDCDDTNPGNHPKAVEVCDGFDNDCDGEIDEGVLITYYPDNDLDGYGASDQGVFEMCAQLLEGVSLNDQDCNDDDAKAYPGAVEVCDNVDNNCDGVIYSTNVDGDLCDDDDTLTVDTCATDQNKCLNVEVTYKFTCKLPPAYSAADGYFCGSAAFFSGDDVNEVFYTDGNLQLPAKDVCEIVHENDATLFVNSFVAMEGDPSSLVWVGGEYITLTDSLTGETATGTPGNVTLLSPGLNFDYVLDDLAICQ